jgi:hypothetical protein
MLVRLLGDLSEWTWQLLRDAPFRPREETVTEVMLTEMHRLGTGRVWIHKSTVAEEKALGLDWAWAVRTPAGWLSALVQAKNVDGSRFGVYPELRKKSAAEQAEALVHAAQMAGAIPLYAFYNSEVMPFGPDGTVVRMGGCGSRLVRRGARAIGPPWVTSVSPLGVSIAHAEDVVDNVTPPPARNQHARAVNALAMPWECLFCPSWGPGPGGPAPPPGPPTPGVGPGGPPSSTSDNAPLGVNRLSAAARDLARALAAAESSDDDEAQPTQRSFPPWLHSEAPRWADIVRGQPGEELDEDAPAARFFVVIDPLDFES